MLRHLYSAPSKLLESSSLCCVGIALAEKEKAIRAISSLYWFKSSEQAEHIIKCIRYYNKHGVSTILSYRPPGRYSGAHWCFESKGHTIS